MPKHAPLQSRPEAQYEKDHFNGWYYRARLGSRGVSEKDLVKDQEESEERSRIRSGISRIKVQEDPRGLQEHASRDDPRSSPRELSKAPGEPSVNVEEESEEEFAEEEYSQEESEEEFDENQEDQEENFRKYSEACSGTEVKKTETKLRSHHDKDFRRSVADQTKRTKKTYGGLKD